MANITSELNNFRNALRGADVRDSMISAIDKINSEMELAKTDISTQITRITNISNDISSYKTSITTTVNNFESSVNTRLDTYARNETTRTNSENTRISNETTRQNWYRSKSQEYADWFDGNDSKNIVGAKTLELQRQDNESTRESRETIRVQQETARENWYMSARQEYNEWFNGDINNNIVGAKDFVINLRDQYLTWFNGIQTTYNRWFDGDSDYGIVGVKALETQRQNNEIQRQRNETTRSTDFSSWFSITKQNYENWYTIADDKEKERQSKEDDRQSEELKRRQRFNELTIGAIPVASYTTAGVVMIGDGFTFNTETGKLSVTGAGDLATKTYVDATFASVSQLTSAINAASTNNSNTYVAKTSVDGKTLVFDSTSNKLSINSNITWAMLGGE